MTDAVAAVSNNASPPACEVCGAPATAKIFIPFVCSAATATDQATTADSVPPCAEPAPRLFCQRHHRVIHFSLSPPT